MPKFKKKKRHEIVKQIIQETGLTNVKKTPAYFSRSQLLDLLSTIRDYKSQLLESLTTKEDNDVTENSQGS